ncbi:hypothetical protein QM012_007534 [Aureobasidium pullulans]|uniref:Uncharacterized protein n=1 Tax=Aureobasidium pullulans TaxID=5580 RepID=A0ABR0TNI0_AURPU
MKFTAVASLAFVGAVAAQNSTAGAATGCIAKYNTCRTTPVDGLSANQAQCAADNAKCQGDCYAAYNTCRTTPVDGLSANQAACAGEYAQCLGENPIASTGGLISSFIPYSATATVSKTASASSASASASASGCVAKDNACRASDPNTGASANQAQCSAENAQCQGDCYAAYNTCRTTPVDGLSANQAACAGKYAQCLGENPIASTGGIISSFIPYTATASSSAGMVYTTEVVTALTTVCPAPTAGAYVTTIASKVYTISSATTITVTDCPCTISSKVPAAANGMMTSAGVKNNVTATTKVPAIYTGAAAHLGAGMGFLGAAAGAVMLL